MATAPVGRAAGGFPGCWTSEPQRWPVWSRAEGGRLRSCNGLARLWARSGGMGADGERGMPKGHLSQRALQTKGRRAQPQPLICKTG